MYLFFAYAILALAGLGSSTLMADAYAGLSETGAIYWDPQPSFEKMLPVAVITAIIALGMFWNPSMLKRRNTFLIPFSLVVAVLAGASAYAFGHPLLQHYGLAFVPIAAGIAWLFVPAASGRMTPRVFTLLPTDLQGMLVATGEASKRMLAFAARSYRTTLAALQKAREAMERINEEQAVLQVRTA